MKNDQTHWRSRGYLPHFDAPEYLQSITFRLVDSVPAQVIQEWKRELQMTESTQADAPEAVELRKRIARYEDHGHGACWLRIPAIASMVENVLLHFDNQRYRIFAWCVMPNHVHGLVQTFERWPLRSILHSWKSYSAKEANRELGRSGAFWAIEYHDRFIRDANHYRKAVDYIEQNPVTCGLAREAKDWVFSSARRRRRKD